MNAKDLRNELEERNINSKGLKSQLVARLSKALKSEAEKNDDGNEIDKKYDDTTGTETSEAYVEEEKLEVSNFN